jgi:hypothetical protein
MTDRTDGHAGDLASPGMVERADAALRSFTKLRREVDETAEWLSLVRGEGEPADLPKAAEIEKVAKELRRALLLVVELEGKVADAERIARGGDGIDLEAARVEVWRRLGRRVAVGEAEGLA